MRGAGVVGAGAGIFAAEGRYREDVVLGEESVGENGVVVLGTGYNTEFAVAAAAAGDCSTVAAAVGDVLGP